MNYLKRALVGLGVSLVAASGSAGASSLPSPQFSTVTAAAYSGGQATGVMVKPGTTWRSLEDIFSEQLDARSYGAVMDGSSDDTQALAALQEAAQAKLTSGQSVAIHFPTGSMLIGAPLTLTISPGEHVSVTGAPGFRFVTTGSNGAVRINMVAGPSSTPPRVFFGNLTAEKAPGAQTGGNAFEYNGTAPLASFRSDGIRCEAMNGAFYTSCLRPVNVIRSDIANTTYEANGTGGGSPTEGAAIWLDATPDAYSADNHVRGVSGGGAFAGVLITGHNEGVSIDQDNIVGSAYCVAAPGQTWPGSSGLAMTYDLISIIQSHCDTKIRGIYMVGGTSLKVGGGSMFYNGAVPTLASDAFLPATTSAIGGSANATTYVGVDAVGVSNVSVSHAEFQGFMHANSWGTYINSMPSLGSFAANSNDVEVSNNFFSSFTQGSTYVGSGVNRGVVALNWSAVNGTYVVQPSSVLNLFNRGTDGSYQSSSTNEYVSGGIFLGSGTKKSVLTSDSDGNATFSGALSAATLSATGNIMPGTGNSVILQDTSGSAGYVQPDGTSGGVNIGTLKDGAVPTLYIGAQTVESLNSTEACTSERAGRRATVSDAANVTFGAVASGGGTHWSGVLCDPGTGWIYQ